AGPGQSARVIEHAGQCDGAAQRRDGGGRPATEQRGQPGEEVEDEQRLRGFVGAAQGQRPVGQVGIAGVLAGGRERVAGPHESRQRQVPVPVGQRVGRRQQRVPGGGGGAGA